MTIQAVKIGSTLDIKYHFKEKGGRTGVYREAK